MLVFNILLSVPIFLACRLLPLIKSRHRGCDAYYFLLCAEYFRKYRRVPIVLPDLYLLELNEQWYPPLFSVVLGFFPIKFLKKYYWAINHFIDLIVGIALFIFLQNISGYAGAWCILILYATEPNLVQEYSTLTSRSLSTLLFFCFLFFTFLTISVNFFFILFAVFIGAVLFYSHKLSMQLLWFLCPFLLILTAEWLWIVNLFASYALAAVVYPSMFLKIWRAHIDILAFWYRNWPWLGTHQFYDSPVYGKKQRGRYFRLKGFRLCVFNLLRIGRKNPWLGVIIVGLISGIELEGSLFVFFQILVGILVWAYLTLSMPFLRFLGEGTKYVKYSLPITIYLSIIFLFYENSFLVSLVFIITAIWHLGYYLWSVRNLILKESKGVGQLSNELLEIIEKLKKIKNIKVLCIPSSISDLIAYYTRCPVFWGTHNYGFKEVEPFFPIIRKPVENFMYDYGLTHLLLDTSYLNEKDLQFDERWGLNFSIGSWRLYSFCDK